jgi:hypothetical protein
MLFQLEEMKVRNFLRYKSFYLGFALSLFVLVVKNYLNYHAERGSIIGKPYSFGFPFDLYRENGYSYELYLRNGFTDSSQILWLGLAGDILFALFFSFFVGLAFKFVWLEIKARLLNLK